MVTLFVTRLGRNASQGKYRSPGSAQSEESTMNMACHESEMGILSDFIILMAHVRSMKALSSVARCSTLPSLPTGKGTRSKASGGKHESMRWSSDASLNLPDSSSTLLLFRNPVCSHLLAEKREWVIST